MKFSVAGWVFYVKDTGERQWVKGDFRVTVYHAEQGIYIAEGQEVKYLHNNVFEDRKTKFPEVFAGGNC
eukprot:4059230-Lingulodinium_polyedra.AAC.1